MIWLFVCGVVRVAIPTAFVVLAFTDPDIARALTVPFAVLVWLVAIYDSRGLWSDG